MHTETANGMKPSRLAISLAVLSVNLIATACAPIQEARQPKLELSAATRQAFEEYKTNVKFLDFKAFAVDPESGSWGYFWGLPHLESTIERALHGCRKRARSCELYAIGDTVVFGMSAAQIASISAEYRDKYKSVEFDSYLSSPEFSHFKAFAVDPNSPSWGRGWGQTKPKLAIDWALRDCRNRSYPYTAHEKCEVYAVGNTIVSAKSSEEMASLARKYFVTVAEAAGFSGEEISLTAAPETGKRLSSDEIEFQLSGRTVKGTIANGSKRALTFSEDGKISGDASMTGDVELGHTENGTWLAKDDLLCVQWERWLSSAMRCLTVLKDGNRFRTYDSDGMVVGTFVISEGE